ncbi:MAG TPA: hypothetical protein VES19_08610, partial [Candidatus Limnocylindrales bacterium]|nr:hypothetical protein [Candidatus Limnocylindrales bacterium]
CAGCAGLHHDLRAIALALPALPAPVRTRDFRLTSEQAASLRPSGWRRLLAPLAGPRFAFAGPLGTGLATLGIAGFLIAGSVGMPLAGTAAAPQADPEATHDVSALIAPSEAAPAASDAAAASLPIEMVPGTEGPAAAGYGPVGGEGGGVVVSGNATAASPAPDGGVTGTNTGNEGPMGPPSTDPKASNVGDRQASLAPDESGVFMTAMDAPPETMPATMPLLVLAAACVATGVLLGGLRLLARRTA